METESIQQREPYLERKTKEIAVLQEQYAKLQDNLDKMTKPAAKAPSSARSQSANQSKSEMAAGAEDFKQNMDIDVFCDLRDLFESYASIGNCMKSDQMKLTLFHKLFIDLNLYTPKNSRKTVEVLFCRANKTRTIPFSRFLSILGEVGKEHFRSEADQYARVEKYAKQYILQNSSISADRAAYKVWNDTLADEQIQEYVNSKSTMLTSLFNLYRTVVARRPDSISIDNMANLAKDFGLIPDLLSKPDVARLFRAVQSSVFHEAYIAFEDFRKLLCFIAIFYYNKTGETPVIDCIVNFFNGLEINSGIIESTYGSNAKNARVEAFNQLNKIRENTDKSIN